MGIQLRESDILQLRREVHSESYYDFFIHFWDEISAEKLVPNWHLKVVCGELQKVGELVIDRKPKEYDLIVNIPPSSSKSSMATVLFPVWMWTKDPSVQLITSSFSSPLSIKHASDSREVIRSKKFQDLYGHLFSIKRDEDSKTFYRNDKGGFRIATSSGANITGNHAHLLICDDLIDPKGVKSDTILTGVNEYLNKTLNSRKVDKANTPTILVMQRLHEEDPTGDWLEKAEKGKKKIRHICLPATTEFEVKPPELKENYIGGLFDPIRQSLSVLEEEKESLGSVDFAGQYGQSPRATEGNKVKFEWFNYCDERELPKISWDLWLDGAYTEKTSNDPTGLMIAGFDRRTRRVYIKHFHSAYMGLPELLKFIPEYASMHGLDARSRIRIEPKASGKSLRQMINAETNYSAVEIKNYLVQEGKESRLQIAAPKIEAGKFWVVKGSWNDDFTYQLCTFPNAKHDEAVDLSGYACYQYFKSGGLPQAV